MIGSRPGEHACAGTLKLESYVAVLDAAAGSAAILAYCPGCGWTDAGPAPTGFRAHVARWPTYGGRPVGAG